METNTVLLDLNVYNDLRDFKENFTKENTIMVRREYHHNYTLSTCNPYSEYKTYITESQAIKEIEHINENLLKDIEDYKQRIFNLTHPVATTDINDLKKKGLLGIIKWWIKNKN